MEKPNLLIANGVTRYNCSQTIRHGWCRFNKLGQWDYVSRVFMRIGVSPHLVAVSRVRLLWVGCRRS